MTDVAVVWLDQGSGHEDAARALDQWARARGVHLAPLEERPAGRVDASIAERVEKDLDRARDAIGSSDADTAERALARAEATLRDHPELPQAGWLRAEVERGWSARWLRLEPRDEARARTAAENAQALDGGRVAGIGEIAVPPRPRVKATIIATGFRSPRLTVRLDETPLDIGSSDGREAVFRVDIAPGEHHLHATVDGRVVFASWIAIAGAEPTPTRINIADGDACARSEFADVRRVASEPSGPSGRRGQVEDQIQAANVTCPQWVAATPTDRRGSVLVARCERDVCGPLLEWRVDGFGVTGPPQRAEHGPHWPAWATWTLVGIGAAAATSVALIATGVFETRPVEPRFVVGGVRQE